MRSMLATAWVLEPTPGASFQIHRAHLKVLTHLDFMDPNVIHLAPGKVAMHVFCVCNLPGSSPTTQVLVSDLFTSGLASTTMSGSATFMMARPALQSSLALMVP